MSDATAPPRGGDPGEPVEVSAPERVRAFITDRPVAILMLFIAAVVFGYFSYGRLPVTLMPELTYPTLTVRTEYPGAAPEEVENDISRPVEDALGVIGGLQQISSVSRAEVSDVILEFAWDIDISDATQDVLERLDLVFLPDEAERPLILHFAPALDPILELSLSGAGARFEGEAGLRRLRRLADLQVKRELEPIRGVAAVRVKGGLEEEIHVILNASEMRRTGISIQQVINRLAQENINVAGGTIEEGRTQYLVRTLNEYENLDEIGETIVAVFDDRPVRLRDVGYVERAHRERQIITRTDGNESVLIEIFKEADANIVALAHRVKAAVGELEPLDADTTTTTDVRSAGGARGGPGERGSPGSRPTSLAGQLHEDEGARLTLVADRSLFIESSISEVRNTAVIGGLLAIAVLYLFLRNFKTTAIIGVSIPVSLLVTFAPLHLTHVTLNIMSLGGLALGIGMLVDSSVVVLESIHRCREEGDRLRAAAIRGVGEVRAAVLASTLTSIAVFFPMVFVEGVAGQAFGDLGMAVVFSLLASAAVALWLIPMLASRGTIDLSGMGEDRSGRWYHFASWRGFVHDWRASGRLKKLLVLPVIYWVFRLVLGFVLELVGALITAVFRALMYLVTRVLAVVVRFVIWGLAWIPAMLTDVLMRWLGAAYPSFLRRALRRRGLVFTMVLLTIAGTALLARGLGSELLPEVRQGEFTVEVSLPVGTPLEENDRLLTPIEEAILAEREHIKSVLLTLGYDPAQSERSDEGEHTATVKILLEQGNRRNEDAVVERLRRHFAGVPDLTFTVSRPVLFSSDAPIEVEVHTDDLRRLRQYSERVRGVMSEMDELDDVRTTLHTGAPEIQVVYDRERLMRYDLNLGAVARLVRDRVQGYEATRFNRVDRRIPIVVRLTEADRETVTDIEDMIVNPGGERPITLGSVATIEVGEGPSEVRRIDGRRAAVVTAAVGDGSLGSSVDAIRTTLLREVDWPEGVTFYISGQNEEWERSRGSLILALGLSIFLVYVIMAVQFESLVHPLVIMFSIPLAFVGTILALSILGIPVSVVVFLGMIMLAGIVVNNAIVLVDYVNQLRRRGMERTEAIVTAGSVRLRPILMTTATTVLGLLPMALGLGDGAEIRTPMAIAVITGLISSTILTLVVIPTVYASVDGLFSRSTRAVGSVGDMAPAGGAVDARTPLDEECRDG